jgi:GTP-binding protein EngB required for normal cell division
MSHPSLYDSDQPQQDVLIQRDNLIAALLSAPVNKNNAVTDFKDFLYGDFLWWITRSSLGDSGADAINRLQGVLNELEIQTEAQRFKHMNLLAVAGGFSSGKSSFITSLMETSELGLPVGIEPVTSIPTFVIPGAAQTVKGYTAEGGVVDIDKFFYKKLSHKFISNFGFNLRKIMPFAAIETPLRGLKNLALLDLPGFGAAASTGSHTQDDDETALIFLSQCSAVLWILGIDANGTIPISDLNHLHDIAQRGHPFYIVLNKADMRTESAVTSVIDHMSKTLREQGLKPAGICAYSSFTRETFEYRGKSLTGFLRSFDFALDRRKVLIDQVSKIFRRLQTDIHRLNGGVENGLAKIKQIEADLTELGLFDQGIPHDDMRGLGGHRRKRRIETIANSIWQALCAIEEQISLHQAQDAAEQLRSYAGIFKAFIRQGVASENGKNRTLRPGERT